MIAYNPESPDDSISVFSNLIANSDGCNFLVGQMKKIKTPPAELSTYVVNFLTSTEMECKEHGKNILIKLLTTQHGHDVLFSIINAKTKLSNQLIPRLIEELNTTYQEKNNDSKDIQSILKGTYKGKKNSSEYF